MFFSHEKRNGFSREKQERTLSASYPDGTIYWSENLLSFITICKCRE